LELPHAEHGALQRTVLHSGVNDARVRALTESLERYFSGLLEMFSNIPLDLRAGTPFQREVWESAREIRWGQTMTYGELAVRMGKPLGAARAVGHALWQNPVALLVPCHRFIGKDGTLHGFAAGLEWKQDLLGLEGCLLA